MDWGGLQQELARARRDRLKREIGSGPHLVRIATYQVEAAVLRCAAGEFEREALLLKEAGLSRQAADARGTALRLQAKADEEDARAAVLEAEQVGAADVSRYVDLRNAIRPVTRDVEACDRANELCQAVTRLGPRATRALWGELRRHCAAQRLRIPADLENRFREAVHRAGAQRDAVLASPGAPHEGPRELLLAVEALLHHAPNLERDDLFDQIEMLAARLKVVQEESLALLDADERRMLRRGFGVLTRISHGYQPGFTVTLDGRTTGKDWRAIGDAAGRRIAERAERRKAAVAAEKLKQVGDALRDLRDVEQAIVFQEALDRLRARLFELDRGVTPAEAASMLREARTQAAIACRAAGGGGERLARLAALLEGRTDVVARGRVFRPLWGALGMGPESQEAAEQAAPDLDQDEVDFATGDLRDEWPSTTLQARGIGHGERVLLVGGIPNEDRKRLLRDFFSWNEVSWEESYREHAADLRTLRGRITSRAFDRVIVLSRFCGHDVTVGLGEVTRRAGIPFHVHPRGVSVTALASCVYGGAQPSDN